MEKILENIEQGIANGLAKRKGVVFTEDDLDSCWPYFKTYLLEILNGEYDVDAAREDLKGLIGSKYDPRN